MRLLRGLAPGEQGALTVPSRRYSHRHGHQPLHSPVTPRARGGGDTKARILDAAEEVVLRDGVARLTLDAAAAEAGLSKGGVLYHFPTRDSLVAGMVAKIIEEFDHDIECRLEADRRPGCFTRAYIGATMEPSDRPARP